MQRPSFSDIVNSPVPYSPLSFHTPQFSNNILQAATFSSSPQAHYFHRNLLEFPTTPIPQDAGLQEYKQVQQQAEKRAKQFEQTPATSTTVGIPTAQSTGTTGTTGTTSTSTTGTTSTSATNVREALEENVEVETAVGSRVTPFVLASEESAARVNSDNSAPRYTPNTYQPQEYSRSARTVNNNNDNSSKSLRKRPWSAASTPPIHSSSDLGLDLNDNDEMRDIIMSEFMNESSSSHHNKVNMTDTDNSVDSSQTANIIAESDNARVEAVADLSVLFNSDKGIKAKPNTAYITVSDLKQIIPPNSAPYDPSAPSYLSIIIPSTTLPNLQGALAPEDTDQLYIEISTLLMDVSMVSSPVAPLTTSVPMQTVA
jgi:hypothetical protein